LLDQSDHFSVPPRALCCFASMEELREWLHAAGCEVAHPAMVRAAFDSMRMAHRMDAEGLDTLEATLVNAEVPCVKRRQILKHMLGFQDGPHPDNETVMAIVKSLEGFPERSTPHVTALVSGGTFEVQAKATSRVDAALTNVYHVFQPRPGTPTYTRTRSELLTQHSHYWSWATDRDRAEVRANAGPQLNNNNEGPGLASDVTATGSSVVVAAICLLGVVLLFYSLVKRVSRRSLPARTFGVSEAPFASSSCNLKPSVSSAIRPHWLPPPICTHCHAKYSLRELLDHVCPRVSSQDCCAVCLESFAERRPAVLLQKDGSRACTHFSTCTVCVGKMRQGMLPAQCPICRAVFTDHQPLAQHLVI